MLLIIKLDLEMIKYHKSRCTYFSTQCAAVMAQFSFKSAHPHLCKNVAEIGNIIYEWPHCRKVFHRILGVKRNMKY